MSLASDDVQAGLDRVKKLAGRDYPDLLNAQMVQALDETQEAFTEHLKEWRKLKEENEEYARRIEESEVI